MKIKHCLLSLALSLSLGFSMIITTLPVIAAETAEGAEQPIDEKSPADDTAAVQGENPDQNSNNATEKEEQINDQPKEDVIEDPTASGTEEIVTDTDEDASDTAESAFAEPDTSDENQAVSDPVESDTAVSPEETKADTSAEEIKEASIDSLQYGWEGPGLYTFYDSNGKIIGYKYMLTSTKVFKGFKIVEGDPYYFDAKTGYMKAGWFTVNGYKYYGSTASKYENGRGILYTGLKVIGGHHYYFFKSTKDGHYGKTMAKNTWVTTGGQKFYAGKDGKLICKFKSIGGKGYYFYPSGTSSHKYGQMAKGWFTYNGFKYYANPFSRILSTGFKTINGIHYYFYPKTSGKHYAKTMAKGWFWANGYKYYADSDGELVTGWRTINGVKYYFWPTTSNGHYSRTMARNGTFTIDDTTYKFDSNGKSTIKKFTPTDLVNFLNKKNIYRAKIHCPNEEEFGTYYICTLSIPQGDGAPHVADYVYLNKNTGYAHVEWNGWEGINWNNANKYTEFYITY